ncbi:hypothetical protein ANCCEY_08405 [Ancylostoma ceylanicum]|nr:hypothetical protein ANCCEY_08405 [Ancylostoma ceylanicum]EYC14544.1 hypothetical protein Y032_0040g268 [Ancylostoma ceylanicum]
MYSASARGQRSLRIHRPLYTPRLASFDEVPTSFSLRFDEMPNRKYSLPPDITVENPFSKREAWIFVIVYSCCVVFLVCLYEYLMPVFNNPTYPYYNYVPDYSFKPPTIT